MVESKEEKPICDIRVEIKEDLRKGQAFKPNLAAFSVTAVVLSYIGPTDEIIEILRLINH